MATRLNTNTMSELTRGSFHMDAELARSSGGVVYRARVRSTGQTVVLKQRLRPELGAQRNMLNEVELLQRLHHPHVIRCLGHFWDSASLYMVLEHADRGDLYVWLQRRKDTRAPPLEERTVWHLFYQICQGLQHIHSKGIVHRDVKPSNVMLSTIDRGVFDCKLCDFGLARPFHPSAGNSNTITAGVQTSATVGFGTSQYMSPEQM